MHPLDLTYPFVVEIDGKNATVCINTYQYLTLDPNSFVGFDVILGDAFLRNVYASCVLHVIFPSYTLLTLPQVRLRRLLPQQPYQRCSLRPTSFYNQHLVYVV